MNYFATSTAAGRYAADRPYFHPEVIERVRVLLGLKEPVALGVDVACGTGMSAMALAAIAQSVIGVDLSANMLALAPPHERIRYLEAPAEALPVEDHTADLLTVSLAFHWLDRPRFLAEARRVLRPQGALVIYWNRFTGRMQENPDFQPWFDREYFARYPTPPRDDRPFGEGEARAEGFIFLHREKFTHEVVYSPEELVRNFTTHSNVIARIENGAQTKEVASQWLLGKVRPFFPAEKATFIFAGEILIVRPTAGAS